MKGKMSPVIAGAAMVLLILDSRQGLLSGAEGVQICVQTVVPSLFPFFVLSIYLTGSLSGSPWLRPLGRLFGCPGCEGILVTGLLGGYPVGAQAAAQAWRRGQISREGASRLLAFCSQAGPAFLFGMAAAQFPRAKYGWFLWAVQLLSCWTVARLMPGPGELPAQEAVEKTIMLSDAMKKALSAMASVCGWVILFRVILGFCQRWFLWLLPETVQVLLCGLLEITNGCILLSRIGDIRLRFVLAVVFLNWGGLCVGMQTASVAQGLSLKAYLRGKLLQALCALGYGAVFLGYPLGIVPIIVLFALRIPGKSGKSSSIPAPVGV